MASEERARLIQEENKRIRRLRFFVDLTVSVLYQDTSLTLMQGRKIVQNTERAILRMFPDKQLTFGIVVLPRFERVLRERWGEGMDDRFTSERRCER